MVAFFKTKLDCKFLNLENHISPLSDNIPTWNPILSERSKFQSFSSHIWLWDFWVSYACSFSFSFQWKLGPYFLFQSGNMAPPMEEGWGITVPCPPGSYPQRQTQHPVGSAAQRLGSPPCPSSVHSLCCSQDAGASSHLRNGPETSLNKQGACFSYKGSSFPFFGLFIRHPSTWYSLFSFKTGIFMLSIIFYPEVFLFYIIFYWSMGFPHSLVRKESACNAGDLGFDSWVRKIPWRRKW